MLVDAHVHIYDTFDPARCLDAAWSNFHRCDADSPVHVLMLAETATCDFFRQFRAAGNWRVRTTSERCARLVCQDDEPRLVLIAGRQIVTAERIEVLALACHAHFPDGRPIGQTLDAIRRADGLPVLPFGLGKWRGLRGSVVKRLLEEAAPGELYIGDNAGRWRFGGWPTLFNLAARRGIHRLAGTDPLPLPSEVEFPGSFGFVIDTPVTLATPATDIVNWLRQTHIQPTTFGQLCHPIHLARRQLALRTRRIFT